MVKRSQIFGGILLLAAAGMLFLFLDSDASLPIAIALAVAGIALIAGSRRRAMR